MLSKNHYFSIFYVVLSSVLLTAIVIVQAHRYSIFGTRLLLGWDSPGYVCMARDLIKNGPLDKMSQWNAPQLYIQLLSLLGVVANDVLTVERILPLFFGILLIYANHEITHRITGNVHFAGLASFLTVLSPNVLRLLADLHRNLMAFSLAMLSFLFVPNLNNTKSILGRKYLVFASLLFIIAFTHFETYFTLSLSLLLYGLVSARIKNILLMALTCLAPVVILVSLFPAYFLSYAGNVFVIEQGVMFNELILWIGGSLIPFGLLITGAAYLMYTILQRHDGIALLIFSYFCTIVTLALSIMLAPFLPVDFVLRTLFLLPTSILVVLGVFSITCISRKSTFLQLKLFSARRYLHVKVSIYRLSLLIILPSLLISSLVVAFYNVDVLLATYIPRSGYNKILTASRLLANNGLEQPVVLYYGYPSVWYAGLFRSYFGIEVGEHFSYYGNLESLYHLIPSELMFEDDPLLFGRERQWSTLYYSELVGNWSGLMSLWAFSHDSYITSAEELSAHPVIVITPELYNDKIPYYLRPFHTGDGIYIIPPNSILKKGEVVYGASITVQQNGLSKDVRSEYIYADPKDPSLIILRINASSGYEAYNFTNIPSSWDFLRLEQGGDQSFPELNAKRLDGAKASSGNDPADSLDDWSIPSLEQRGAVELDPASRKEGDTSLKAVGVTDSWGSLGVRYDPNETLDLSTRFSLAVWAKASEKATFSITLRDLGGETRTFWGIQAYGSSVTTEWKRFVVDIKNYTDQTPNFDLSTVDSIDFYVSSGSGKEFSFWIDDLIADDFFQPNGYISKARVLTEDLVIAYFVTRAV